MNTITLNHISTQLRSVGDFLEKYSYKVDINGQVLTVSKSDYDDFLKSMDMGVGMTFDQIAARRISAVADEAAETAKDLSKIDYNA